MITDNKKKIAEKDTIAVDSVVERLVPFSECVGTFRAVLSELNCNALVSEKLDDAVSCIADAVAECSFYDKCVIIRTEDIVNAGLIRLTIMSENMYYRKTFMLSKCTGILENIIKEPDENELACGAFSLDAQELINQVTSNTNPSVQLRISVVKKQL